MIVGLGSLATKGIRYDIDFTGARALNDVLDLFPVLGQMSGRLAGTLSGGQQQQLAIGRALIAAANRPNSMSCAISAPATT